jgi:hypothetical protein
VLQTDGTALAVFDLPVLQFFFFRDRRTWKGFLDKKIKAKKVTLLYGREALRMKENQTRLSCLKAYFEGNLVRVLSFEEFMHRAWTHVDR